MISLFIKLNSYEFYIPFKKSSIMGGAIFKSVIFKSVSHYFPGIIGRVNNKCYLRSQVALIEYVTQLVICLTVSYK